MPILGSPFSLHNDRVCLLMKLADLVIHVSPYRCMFYGVNLATPEICATMSIVRLPPIVIYSL